MLLAERHPSTGTTLGANSTRGYVALLPLSDTYACSTLHRWGTAATTSEAAPAAAVPHAAQPEPSSLALSSTTGDPATPLPGTLGVMLVAVGKDPFRLMRRLVHESTERLRAQLDVSVGAPTGTPTGARTIERGKEEEEDEEAVAEFVTMFGWCTWDSFYTMVTPEGAVRWGAVLMP